MLRACGDPWSEAPTPAPLHCLHRSRSLAGCALSIRNLGSPSVGRRTPLGCKTITRLHLSASATSSPHLAACCLCSPSLPPHAHTFSRQGHCTHATPHCTLHHTACLLPPMLALWPHSLRQKEQVGRTGPLLHSNGRTEEV